MYTTPTISYFICATPRSGSTLLCEALRNTGLAGNPDEYFGPMHIARWNEKWKTDTGHEYLQRVLEHGTGINRVWGAKVMRLYWQNFLSLLKSVNESGSKTETARLENFFPKPKYIFITRRNKVRQAVSWLKFLQGSAWFWEKEEPQKLENLEFKPEVIDGFLQETAIHESAWLEFFESTGTRPYIVVYEDLVETYEETAKGILDYLGIEYPNGMRFAERRLKKQADALSDEWVQRYLNLRK